MVIRETRKRARLVVGPVLAITIIGYFLYHTVQGERGLVAYAALSEQARIGDWRLAQIRAKRLEIEHNVRLLRPDSLDLDMLEERSRAVLNVIDDDDVLIHDDFQR
jgi:cell division protein FtsB